MDVLTHLVFQDGRAREAAECFGWAADRWGDSGRIGGAVRASAQTLRIDVVFVIGLAIEVAGAALLAAGQIRLVDLTVVTRETTVEPRREAHQVAARFTVGFLLLALGVVVQLVGYAVDGGWWLVVVAIGVVAVARVIGLAIADTKVTTWLHGRAVDYWQASMSEDEEEA